MTTSSDTWSEPPSSPVPPMNESPNCQERSAWQGEEVNHTATSRAVLTTVASDTWSERASKFEAEQSGADLGGKRGVNPYGRRLGV